MQILLNTICSLTSFGIISAVVLSILPKAEGLKKSLLILTGVIGLLIVLPLFKIDLSEIKFDDTLNAEYSKDIDDLLNERILNAVKSEISEKSKAVLNKYGISQAKVALNAQIYSENGIFIQNVNYIITDGLSSTAALEAELSKATGYNCKVLSEAEYE